MQQKKDVVDTERLTLRPIVNSDLDDLYPMYQNPNVMQYIYDGSLFSPEKAKTIVDAFTEHWQQHGFGMWLLQMKSNNNIVGYAGLRYFEDDRPMFHRQIELGYIIDEPYWGKGYASESIAAIVQSGLDKYNMQRILATILPENIASQKVVIKAGMKHTLDAEFDGLSHQIYEINKAIDSTPSDKEP